MPRSRSRTANSSASGNIRSLFHIFNNKKRNGTTESSLRTTATNIASLTPILEPVDVRGGDESPLTSPTPLLLNQNSPTGSSIFATSPFESPTRHVFPSAAGSLESTSTHHVYPSLRSTVSRRSLSTFSLPSLLAPSSPSHDQSLKVLFHNNQNMDILGVIMQLMDHKTRQSASVVCRAWQEQFLLVILPQERQYFRVLKSRHHYRAALHLYRRKNPDGSSLFLPDFEDNLPLRCFARFGAFSVVKELLANETVSPGACNQRALRKAAKHGNFKCCKLLLAHKEVHPTAQCVIKALDRKQFSVVKLLLDDGRIDPSMEDGAILHRAASCGQLDLVHILLKNPEVRPESKDNRALRYAAYNGHAEVVQFLLKFPEVNPFTQNYSALRRASKRGHTDVVQVLLEDSRCKPASFVHQMIRDAQEENHSEIVDMLLTKYVSTKRSKQDSQRSLRHTSSVSSALASGGSSSNNGGGSSSPQPLSVKLERLVSSILHPTQTVRRISM
eukprot:CAMPEP_0117435832 /NCGR_PEP_ID=MMETSP0759-20121206/688_1 /TAXON_ID=63605 /ORGANISM="Percolomonas cosmopolitus, Strain WS" /LENGTH=500 /DNA_ID=CAMNT_0005227399 /DNA_START=297 /DNA_END=1799 /DNA_ORIENTATION=+